MWDFSNSATAQINQLFEIKWCQINISEGDGVWIISFWVTIDKNTEKNCIPKGMVKCNMSFTMAKKQGTIWNSASGLNFCI